MVRSGLRVRQTGKARSAGHSRVFLNGEARPSVLGEECNDDHLKLSSGIYLSTSSIVRCVHRVEKFAPTGVTDGGPWPPPSHGQNTSSTPDDESTQVHALSPDENPDIKKMNLDENCHGGILQV
ncbi:hypothetical protein AVEN_201803-1 [Araneus ventricosus]|uniref:Uncharacterized protein n=1 Tax=Araneus ventricosus TaxID=182803 RepID=A0A4Y2LEW0_ARAVE|nr:hypothetical protein AVEN_201803-1 [Araneus ventricosus]